MTTGPNTELYVSLRDHFDSRINEMDRRIFGAITDRDARIQIALTAAKEAVDKAEAANERRLGLLNEFRSQQADEARKYLERSTATAQFEAISLQVNRNENGLTALMAQTASLADVEKRITRLENTLAGLQGRAAVIGGIIALAGGTLAALIVKTLGG